MRLAAQHLTDDALVLLLLTPLGRNCRGVHVQGGREGHPRQAGHGPRWVDSRQAEGAPNRRTTCARQGENHTTYLLTGVNPKTIGASVGRR